MGRFEVERDAVTQPRRQGVAGQLGVEPRPLSVGAVGLLWRGCGGGEGPGEAEDVGELESGGGGGGQGWGPAGGAQDGVVAASDQADEDFADDGAADRAQA